MLFWGPLERNCPFQSFLDDVYGNDTARMLVLTLAPVSFVVDGIFASRYPRRPLPVILCDFVWYFSAVSLVATSAFLTCRELYSSHHRRVISEDRKQAHVSALRSSVEKYLTAEHRALLRQELEPELHDFEEAGAKLTFWPDLFKHDHHALLFFLVANRCAEEAEGLGADDDVTELTKALFFHLETYFFEQHKAALISPCELFGRAVCAIIGAVVKYLIPLPSLRHLERPFRPRILFFFLLSFPGILILRRLWMRFAAAYVPLDMLRNAPLLVDSLIKAVHLFSPLTLSRNLDLEEAKKAIVPWYEAAAPNPNFPRLEEEVHEAILNAILQWKATKEEAKKNKTEGEAVE
ncbi:hypothetical protein JCM8547_002910 [Rhodosporidiobolus lusitaniae]